MKTLKGRAMTWQHERRIIMPCGCNCAERAKKQLCISRAVAERFSSNTREAIEPGMHGIVQTRHVDEKRSLRTCAVRIADSFLLP